MRATRTRSPYDAPHTPAPTAWPDALLAALYAVAAVVWLTIPATHVGVPSSLAAAPAVAAALLALGHTIHAARTATRKEH
jgi:hypothetical protein